MKKILAALGILATFGAAPIIPEEMELQYSYEVPCYAFDIPVEERFMQFEYPITPKNCVDSAAFSVFKDAKGNEVHVEIPRQKYKEMGEYDGYSKNPTKEEYRSVFEAVTPKAEAAITYDNAGSATPGIVAISLTFSFTNNGNFLSTYSRCNSGVNPTIASTVTYNAASLTKGPTASQNGDGRTENALWYKASPATGANNIVITCNNLGVVTGGAISLSGVDTATPVGATQTGNGSADPQSISITTTVANSWVIDGIGWNDVLATLSPTAGSGQTARYTLDEPVGGASSGGSTEPTTTTGSYTMDWDTSGAVAYGMIAIEVLPGAAAASTFLPYFEF